MKKIFLYFLMMILSINLVNALDTNKITAYYAQDDATGNLFDSSGNNNNLTEQGTVTYETGKILEVGILDGSNYLETPINPNGLNNFSFALWVNISSTAQNSAAGILSARDGSTATGVQLNGVSRIRFDVNSGGTISPATNYDDDLYHFVVATYDGSNTELFIDGASVGTNTQTGTVSTNDIFKIGFDDVASSRKLKGSVDEVSIYENYVLNSSEISELYNGGSGFNPYASTAAVITFENPKQGDLINSTNFNLNVSFSVATNSTYSLNGAPEVTFGTDTDLKDVNLTGVEGLNNVTVYSNTLGELSNKSISFTIDTFNPTINNSIPSEINDYSFNGTLFSCSDINLDSCNISINGFNKASGENFTLNNNGNLTYTITAIDLAGNSVSENGVLFVNPIIYFSFNDSGSLIQDYKFGGRSDVAGLVNYTIYEDGLNLGNNSLVFDKLGYILQNISFSLDNTTNQNFTFDVFPAFVNIEIYDRVTENLITENTTVQLIGAIGDIDTTTTGLVNFQTINGTPGNYQIIASNLNYETESAYFSYSNQENVTIKLYMLESNETNIGVVNVLVKDSLSFLVEGATVNLLEWVPAASAYETRAQCETASNGVCQLNIELFDKLYKFQAVKDSVEKTTSSQILSETGQTVPITLDDIVLESVDDLNEVVYIINETITGNNSLVRLQWTDTSGFVSKACITSYRDTGFSRVQIAQNCSSTSSGILFQDNLINNSYDLFVIGTITSNNVEYKIGEFSHKGTGSITVSLEQNNLDIVLPAVFFLLGLGAGLFFGNIYIALTLIILLEWLAVGLAPSVISTSIASVITVITLLIFWSVSKK